MDKSYLRYRSSWASGVICSAKCNIDVSDGVVACGSVRDVVCWDMSLGTSTQVLRGEVEESGYATSPLDGARGEVVRVAYGKKDSATQLALAAGYASGLVRVWRGRDEDDRVEVDGHRGAVTVLRWCPAACRVCSGGANGDFVVWDALSGGGSCRLRGHSGQATDCCFVGRGWDDDLDPAQKLLVTTARDALLKVWDVDAEHCVQTVYGGGVESALRGVDYGSGRICAAGEGSELRVWHFDENEFANNGSSMRRSRPSEPCTQLRFMSNDGKRIGLLTTTALEVYARRSADVVKKKTKRRLKRKAHEEEEDSSLQQLPTAGDEWELLAVVFPEEKPRSFACWSQSVVYFGTKNNTLEKHRVAGEESLIGKIEVPGHRSAVRAVSCRENAVAAASTSGLKVWDAQDGRLLRSVTAVKKALVVAFFADLVVVVGTKEGNLSIVDLTSGAVTDAKGEDDAPACAGSLWALDTARGGGGGLSADGEEDDRAYCVSGGVDPDLKVWRRKKKKSGALSLKHVKTVRLGEDCLCARYVCSLKYVAAATMDACVRIFFADTMKFKSTLYGHSLSALCLDGTTDGQMLATGSADKSLKFWGLEFGDLRRSSLAHKDAVTALSFLQGTHYLFTASKDGDVKMWDADSGEPFVQTLKRGHIGEVWGLTASRDGSCLYTAGADRSVRKWIRTDEPVFAAEEVDVEIEAQHDEEDDRRRDGGVVVVARSSSSALKASDRLAEALELAVSEDEAASPDHQPSVILQNKPTYLFILGVLASIKSPELEPAILVLPLHLLTHLLDYLDRALTAAVDDPTTTTKGSSTPLNEKLELCARTAHVSVRLHHKAVLAHRPLASTLDSLRTKLRDALDKERRIYGSNLAAIRFAHSS